MDLHTTAQDSTTMLGSALSPKQAPVTSRLLPRTLESPASQQSAAGVGEVED